MKPTRKQRREHLSLLLKERVKIFRSLDTRQSRYNLKANTVEICCNTKMCRHDIECIYNDVTSCLAELNKLTSKDSIVDLDVMAIELTELEDEHRNYPEDKMWNYDRFIEGNDGDAYQPEYSNLCAKILAMQAIIYNMKELAKLS